MKTTSKLLALALLIGSVLPSGAAETFYSKQINNRWKVFGNIYPEKDKNDSCIANYDWDDGSLLQITKELVDNELYIRLQNVTMNEEKQGPFKLRINWYAKKKIINSSLYAGLISAKNILAISNLYEEPFLLNLVKATSGFYIIPPGTIENVYVPLDNMGERILSGLAECVKAARGSIPKTSKKKILDDGSI